jgi:hypothetical protein
LPVEHLNSGGPDNLDIGPITDGSDATGYRMSSSDVADYYIYFDLGDADLSAATRLVLNVRFREIEHGTDTPLAMVTSTLADCNPNDYWDFQNTYYEYTFSIPEDTESTIQIVYDQAAITQASTPPYTDRYVEIPDGENTIRDFIDSLGTRAVLMLTSSSGAPYEVDLLDVTLSYE